MSLSGECLRNNIAGMSCADALPQKRLARPPGWQRTSASLNFHSVIKPPEYAEYTSFAAIFADADAIAAAHIGDAPFSQAVNACAMTLRADLRTRRPRRAVQWCLAPTKAVTAHSAPLNSQGLLRGFSSLPAGMGRGLCLGKCHRGSYAPSFLRDRRKELSPRF